MSIVYMMSDLHLGHKNICRFRTNFQSPEEHDALILDNYRSIVKKRDIVWFLGDVAFTMDALREVQSLPGTKNLVMGNHDTDRQSQVPLEQLFLTFDNIHSLVNYKGFWLSHAPIHTDELRGKRNIHGHTHFHVLDDPRYINVCMEQIGYKPRKFQDIRYEYDTD